MYKRQVLCVLPLVFRDYYFNILETKYQFYCIVSIAALVVMGGYGLASGKMIEWFSKFDFKTWRKGMSFGAVSYTHLYLKKTTGKPATGKQASINGQIYLFDDDARMPVSYTHLNVCA